MPCKKVFNDEWVNAREMNIAHPETFLWSEPPAITDMRRGDIMKVSNGQERFWCSFKKIINVGETYKIIAEVDNVLVSTPQYNLGDWIRFERDNIYEFVAKKHIKNYFNELKNARTNIKTNVVARLRDNAGDMLKALEGSGLIQVPESFEAEEEKEQIIYPHREVAKAFVPNPNGYKYVEHIDGDTTNNHATNLRWVEDGGDKVLFESGYIEKVEIHPTEEEVEKYGLVKLDEVAEEIMEKFN
jgi:hypothetical protein